MNEIAKALKMFVILKSRGRMKAKDLAREIETSQRSLTRYRDQLEMAGIHIDSKSGKHGGYKLINDNYLYGLNLNDREYKSLLIIEKHLKDSKHIVSSDISSITEKINIVYSQKMHDSEIFNNHMSKVTLSNVDIESERKKLIDIHAASLMKKKIRMEYVSLTSGATMRVVHPYATYQYKGDMYFIGYCEIKKTDLDFKLCRIKDYTITDDSFEMPEDFDIKKKMENCIGNYRGKEYKIKLKIKNPMSQIVKEKIWVENQKIKDLENGDILFEAQMIGLEEIRTWIMGMGSYVEVIEPTEIIEEIRNEIKKMIEIYFGT